MKEIMGVKGKTDIIDIIEQKRLQCNCNKNSVDIHGCLCTLVTFCAATEISNIENT